VGELALGEPQKVSSLAELARAERRAVQSPSRSTLICLFRGGGNTGQLRCVQYDGQSWQLQTTFGVGMPAESSPSVGTYMGAVVVTFQGNVPSLSTDMPLAMDGQDTYRRVPAGQQSSVLQAATGGAALQSFVQAQAAATLFLSWLAEADEDAWIQVQDTTTNQFYLVAMQEGGGATDTIEMVLSCTEVDPNQPRSSSAQSPFRVRASDGRLRADRGVDLDRLRGAIAVATSELAAPGASDGPPPYTPRQRSWSTASPTRSWEASPPRSS
jgi:hypothetical protein